VFRKAAGKIVKYKDLTIEIQSMWNTNTIVIPVTTAPSEPSENNSGNT